MNTDDIQGAADAINTVIQLTVALQKLGDCNSEESLLTWELKHPQHQIITQPLPWQFKVALIAKTIKDKREDALKTLEREMPRKDFVLLLGFSFPDDGGGIGDNDLNDLKPDGDSARWN